MKILGIDFAKIKVDNGSTFNLSVIFTKYCKAVSILYEDMTIEQKCSAVLNATMEREKEQSTGDEVI